MKRGIRVLATLALTGLAVAYLVWKIDVGQTADVLADASPWWFLLAVAIMTLTVVPMAERWRRLLVSQGIEERLPWLTRAYPRLVHRRPDPPHFDRRRRRPDRRDLPPPPRTARRDLGDRPARACARRGGHGAPRRHRLRAGDRPLRRRRLSLGRGRLRAADVRARLPDVLAAPPGRFCARPRRCCDG